MRDLTLIHWQHAKRQKTGGFCCCGLENSHYQNWGKMGLKNKKKWRIMEVAKHTKIRQEGISK